MCLGIPGRITETEDDRGTPMATVDFGGVTRSVCLAFTPECGEGDWVIVHAGFAIATLDEEAAQSTLDLFAEIGMVETQVGMVEAETGTGEIETGMVE